MRNAVNKVAAASVFAVGVALLSPAVASADHHIPTPPDQQEHSFNLGPNLSFGVSGSGRLRDYSYSLAYDNGRTQYNLSSTGSQNGISSAQILTTRNGTTVKVVQSYGGDYGGDYCVVCSNASVTGPKGSTWGSNTRLTTDGFSTTTTTPGGSFSWPPR
jgi:hypothetical protein